MGLRGTAAGLVCGWLAVGCPAMAGPLELRVLADNGQPLADAVLFLESREARAAVRPVAGFEIAQVDKAFVARVSVVPVGTAVSFPNRDTVRHHVYSFSPTKKFEIKLYVGTPAAPVVFDQPGIGVMGCNIHDQMTGWVVVVATPWYGKTGSDGVLRLPDVPAGSYRLRSWHSTLPVGAPAADQALEVTAAAQKLTLKLSGATP